jgi:hypothetical protein
MLNTEFEQVYMSHLRNSLKVRYHTRGSEIAVSNATVFTMRGVRSHFPKVGGRRGVGKFSLSFCVSWNAKHLGSQSPTS